MVFGIGPTRRLVETSKKATNEGMPFVVGEARVPALSVYTKISKDHGGSHSSAGSDFYFLSNTQDQEDKGAKEWLYRIDVFAQGPINGYKHFYVDKDRHNWARFRERAYVQIFGFNGETGQTAFSWDSGIASGRWSNHKGVDVAYCVNRFYAHGKYPKFAGEPPVDAVLEGYPLYDPRKDPAEGGAGSHAKGDISTYEYDNNPATGLLTYLTESVGAAWNFSDLDLSSFATAADFCDETMSSPGEQTNQTGAPITYYDPSSGEWFILELEDPYPDQPDSTSTSSQKRTVSSLVLSPDDTVKANIETALQVMHGHLPFSNGKYKLIIEDEVSDTVMSFDDDSILGNWKITNSGRKDRLNRATINFINRDRKYQEDSVSWPKIGSAEYTALLAADSDQPLHQTFDVEGVPDYQQASAWAEYQVRNSRSSRKIKVDLAPKAMLLEFGDVIDITSTSRGWGNKWFRVKKNTLKTDGTCTVELVEYDASIYPWSTKSDMPLDAPLDQADPWLDPVAITGLAASAIHETKADGSVLSGFDVSWNAPTDTGQIEYIEIAWRVSATIDWKNISRVPVENTKQRVTPLQDDEDYDIRVTYRTSLGLVSAEAKLLYQTLSDAESRLSSIEDGATNGDPYGASYNLLGSDAGPEHSFTTVQYQYLFLTPIEDFGLVAGDEVTLGIDLKTDGTAGEYARFRFVVWDAADGFISQVSGNGTTAQSAWERITGTMVLPANAAQLSIDVTYGGGSTGAKYTKSAMLNRGPVALPYVAPYADGADVTDYTATALEFSASSDLTVKGNTLIKSGGTNGAWNTSAAVTKSSVVGSAHLRFTNVVAASRYMAGLKDTGSREAYPTFAFAFYTSASIIYIYESGSNRGSFGAVTAGMVFDVIWDGVNVKYYANGILVHTSNYPPVAGSRFYGAFDFNNTGHLITNISLDAGPTLQSMPNLTLVNPDGKINISGNNLIKTGAASWDAQVYSEESFSGSAMCSFKSGDNAKQFAMGFNSDPATSNQWQDLDYAWNPYSGGAGVVEGGSTKTSYFAYTSTTIFSIVWDGVSVKYYMDGVLKYTSLAPPSPSSRLYLDSAIYNADTAINNITFNQGPTQTADWSGVSGAGIPEDGATVGAPNGTVLGDFTADDLSDVYNKFHRYWITESLAITAADGGTYIRLFSAGSGGRGHWRIAVGVTGGGAVPSGLVFEVSVNWSSDTYIKLISGGNQNAIEEVRTQYTGSTWYFDVKMQSGIGGTTLRSAISYDTLYGSAPVWEGERSPVSYTTRAEMNVQGLMTASTNTAGSNPDNAIDGDGSTYSGGYRSLDDVGRLARNLTSGIGMEQGAGSRVLPRGVWAGTAYDGVGINFPVAYGGPPIVVFQDGGLTQSTALNGTVSPSKAALSLSSSGFTPSLRLKESAGAPVLRTETGATAGGTQDWEIDKSSAGEAWDNRYTFQFDAIITNLYIAPGEYESGWADIGIYTNNGAGWVLRRTVRIAGGGASPTLSRNNNVTTVTVDGLTNHGGREFGVSLVDSAYGGGLTGFDSVKYETATAPSDISSTPSGVSGVPFFVMEGEEA